MSDIHIKLSLFEANRIKANFNRIHPLLPLTASILLINKLRSKQLLDGVYRTSRQSARNIAPYFSRTRCSICPLISSGHTLAALGFSSVPAASVAYYRFVRLVLSVKVLCCFNLNRVFNSSNYGILVIVYSTKFAKPLNFVS